MERLSGVVEETPEQLEWSVDTSRGLHSPSSPATTATGFGERSISRGGSPAAGELAGTVVRQCEVEGEEVRRGEEVRQCEVEGEEVRRGEEVRQCEVEGEEVRRGEEVRQCEVEGEKVRR